MIFSFDRMSYLRKKWLFNEAKAGDPRKPLKEWKDIELLKRYDELSSMSEWQFTKSKEKEFWNIQDEMLRRKIEK